MGGSSSRSDRKESYCEEVRVHLLLILLTLYLLRWFITLWDSIFYVAESRYSNTYSINPLNRAIRSKINRRIM